MSWPRHAFVAALVLAAAPTAHAQPAATAPVNAVDEAHQHFLAGEAAYRAGHWADALEQFSAGFGLDPRPEFLLNLAQTRRHLGRLDEAIANCESFLAVAPTSPLAGQVWKLLGELRERRRAVERGRVAAAEAAQLATAGDWARALEAYQRANFEDIDEPRYLYNLADCFRALHRDAEAVRFYRLYLKERPKDPERPAIEATLRELEHPRAPSLVVAPVEPAAGTVTAPSLVASAPVAEPRRRPVWKRWWFWTAIGGGAAALAIGVGVGVGTRAHGSSFMATLPSFGPSLVTR
jgi:tetratricopeptide (TPR) repeat protein